MLHIRNLIFDLYKRTNSLILTVQNFLSNLGDEAKPVNVSEPSLHSNLFRPMLEPLTPIDITIKPYFVVHVSAESIEKTKQPRSDKKGQLLTPDDGCGLSAVENHRIVGGGPAKKGAWPWMVLLGYYALVQSQLISTFNCDGSIITTRHVLTAAHCVLPEL